MDYTIYLSVMTTMNKTLDNFEHFKDFGFHSIFSYVYFLAIIRLHVNYMYANYK